MSLRLSAPIVAQLELTERCNHSCFYCYNSRDCSLENMSLPHLQRVIDQLGENKVFSVVLTGGEPFMHKEALYFGLEGLRSYSLDPLINTNLSLPLGHEDVSMLRLAQFTLVSFPSSNPERFNDIVQANSFKKVVTNLELLSREHIPFGINQVVSKKNKYDVYETGKFLHINCGVDSFSASPVSPVRKEDVQYALNQQEITQVAFDLLRLQEDFNINIDMLECIPPCAFPQEMRSHRMAHHACTAGKDMLSISTRGLVKRCPKLTESFGNIFLEDLRSIWNKILDYKKPHNQLCNRCTSASECYGGCEVRVLSGNGQDCLVQGSINPYDSIEEKQMLQGKNYRIADFKYRDEGKSILIYGREEGFVVGNIHLLNFLQQIQNQSFTLEYAIKTFGDYSRYVLNYLYARGLVKDAV